MKPGLEQRKVLVKITLLGICILLVLSGTLLMVFSFLPISWLIVEQPFPSAYFSVDEETFDFSNYYFSLVYPQSVHLGQIVTVALTITNMTANDPEFSNASNQFNVQSRFECGGVFINPSGLVDTPLPRVDAITLRWRMEAFREGIQRGTLWIYLQDTDHPEENQGLIFALPITITINSIFGLTLFDSRFLAGALLGAALLIYLFFRLGLRVF